MLTLFAPQALYVHRPSRFQSAYGSKKMYVRDFSQMSTHPMNLRFNMSEFGHPRFFLLFQYDELPFVSLGAPRKYQLRTHNLDPRTRKSMKIAKNAIFSEFTLHYKPLNPDNKWGSDQMVLRANFLGWGAIRNSLHTGQKAFCFGSIPKSFFVC